MRKVIKKKFYKVIGIMSGTSVDGIDFALIKTNGIDYVKIIKEKSYCYEKKYKQKIINFIKKLNKKPNIQLEYMDLFVSKKILNKTNKFLKEFNINKSNVDFIGLSGQTILHKPIYKKTIQLGSGYYLSKKLNINIVSNFREKDLLGGGEGAPIACFYNKYIGNKLNKKIIFVNIGGISNICYVNKSKIIAFDVGPGNSLIDDFISSKTNKNYDKNGKLAFQGKLNKKILNQFLRNKFFKRNYPKSLDREHFKNFLTKSKKLSLNDGAHTLSLMTVYSIIKGINLLNKKIDGVFLTGGGRKNLFIYTQLIKKLNIPVTNIDNIGMNGDLLEAEAFAYIAIRSLKKLPLSLKSTTGVKKPTTGGIIYKSKTN